MGFVRWSCRLQRHVGYLSVSFLCSFFFLGIINLAFYHLVTTKATLPIRQTMLSRIDVVEFISVYVLSGLCFFLFFFMGMLQR